MASTTISIATGADDGFAERVDPNYPPATTITTNTVGITVAVQRVLTGGNYTVRNGLLRFDTSPLAGATINSATLRLNITAKTDNDARNFTGEYYDIGAAIDTTDYSVTPSSSAFSADVTAITVDVDNTTFNDFALTSPDANINKTGYTGLRLHIDGAAPVQNNRVLFATFDHTTLNEPRLIIDYTPAVATGHARMLLTGVG